MATDYRVVSQIETNKLTPSNTFEPYMVVTVEVQPNGETFTVEIPWRSYSAEAAQSMIEQRVATVKAVGAL